MAHASSLRSCESTPDKFVYHVPTSVVFELIAQEAIVTPGAVVWSLWEGYLRDGSGQRLRAQLLDKQIAFSTIHTSGHASVPDLQRLAHAVGPARLVPMHSEATGRFEALFRRVEQHADGLWWEV